MSLNKRPQKLSHGGDEFGRGFPWILCDLMPHGKRLVRGSPDTPEAFWTFCPLKKFLRDKIKISKCEECEHFHGYRKSFSDKVVKSLKEFGTPIQSFQRGQGIEGVGGQGQSVQEYLSKRQPKQQKSSPLNLRVIKPKKKLAKPVKITEEALKQFIEEKKRKDKEWEEEEKRTFSDET